MSDRLRPALHIALALVAAYGLSLWLGWDNVKWAGIASAVCALATGGEALHKGSQRIVGTLIGAAVALIILSFLIQDRWTYPLIATLWIGFCTWKHIANPNGYYWVLAAFIVPLLTIMSGAGSEQAFQTALLRVEQTCLGIVAFSIAATLVFPLSTHGAFQHDACEQTKALRRIFGDTITRLTSRLPDPERVAGTIFVMTSFVLFFLVHVYVPAIPVPVLMLAMGTALAITLASAPVLPLSAVASAGLIGVGVGCAFDVLAMPALEGFAALAVFLFGASFLICWIRHRPDPGLNRTMGICFLVAVGTFDNQQVYSLTASINLGVPLVITMLLFAVALRVPVSFKKEIVFRRLVRRCFASIAAPLATVHVDRREARTWWERQRGAYHLIQIQTIPTRLLPWTKFMPRSAVPTADEPHLPAFAQALSVLSTRVEDILEARDLSCSEKTLRKFLPEMRQWREVLESFSEELSKGEADTSDFRHEKSLYRFLGALRGVKEAFIGMLEPGRAIDWPRLREARI